MKLNHRRTIIFFNTPCLFFILLLFVCSCAQMGSPTGGAYDRTAPKVVRYQPDSASIHFNARSIEITFDEFIQLQDVNNQLLISPPLEFTPELTAKKKTLRIELNKKEVLKSNTTYSISLGNAVKDIRESNSFENFKYVFSTGDFIDSLTFSGNVMNAFDHKSEKNILVMLYSDLSDSAAYKTLPDYFAKTNDVGAFRITNIRTGKYRAVALKDENANYKYTEGEQFGYLDTLIEAGKTQDETIYLYKEAPKKIFLKKYYQAHYGKFQLIFNEGSDSLHITKLNKEELKDVKELLEFSKTKDTLTYWLDHINKDSLILQVNNGHTILDTLRFKLIKKEAALKSKSDRQVFKFTLFHSFHGSFFDLNKELDIAFTHPIEKINDSTNVLLNEDSLAYKKHPLIYSESSNQSNVVKVRTPKKIDAKGSTRNMLLKENTTYYLTILPATFTDFFGLNNDTIKLRFRTKEEKFYGSVKLNLSIESPSGSYIVQLLNEKEDIIRERIFSRSEAIFFDFLYPANYKLKVIFDKNGNGKWDSGNYLKKQQPEKVIYNIEPINIRSNWDLEFEWNITEPK